MTKNDPNLTTQGTQTEPGAREATQQPLPLACVPDRLRDAGLADAHSAPFVGVRTSAGVRSWRTSPAMAWRDVDPYEYVEWSRTGNSYSALILDCDSREAVERAHACSMSAGPVPAPNLTITRRESGHLHAAWLLRTPVHRGARARSKPLTLFGRVSEYYRAALGADAGFVGVLSSNPVDVDRFDTAWIRTGGYELRELARALPAGWRLPAVPTTDAGRNVAVFRAGLRFAGNPRRSDAEVEAFVWSTATEIEAEWAARRHERMSASEIHGIIKSILGHYRAQWRARGWHTPAKRRELVRRGRKGNEVSIAVRRTHAIDRDAAILTAHAAGATVGALAQRFEVHRATVYRAFQGVSHLPYTGSDPCP